MAYNPNNPNGQAVGASSAPVVIASDQPAVNTSLQEAPTGGASVFHLVSLGSTSGTNPNSRKQSTGKITGWYIYNSNGSSRKLNFHDTAGAPVAGSATYFSAVIPALSAANCSFPAGIGFTAGIGITTTTGLADNDTAGVASADLIINIFYK